jgi:Polyketide cyclase / dehydrase and lipid transport
MKRFAAVLLIGGAIFAAGAALVHAGVYGYTIFLLAPFATGALGAWIGRPKTSSGAAGAGVVATMIATFGLVFVGAEGIMCVLMCWPLALPMGAIGGLIFQRLKESRVRAQGIAVLALLPLGTLGWDVAAKTPVYEVRTSIEIAAPPELVWKHVVSFPEITQPREWFFRTGLAYPVGTRMEGHGTTAVRYCDFSTGALVEPIDIWDEPRLLRFQVTENPPPMREWSPYSEIHPKHLHGYMSSKQGQFRLTPLGGGRTLVEGTSWYQHGLWPSQYWRLWSDAIIHRVHMRVLQHIKVLAEAENDSVALVARPPAR